MISYVTKERVFYFCVLLLLLASPLASADKQQYINLITEVSNNPAREIAQTEVESGFNPFAKSPYASGLRQFTKTTGEWASRTMCRSLGPYQEYGAEWQIRCGVIYQQWLEKKAPTTGCYCDTRQNAERAYNGGMGWINKESRIALSNKTEDLVAVCGDTGRAGWACKENTSYHVKISTRATKYAIYGGELCEIKQ